MRAGDNVVVLHQGKVLEQGPLDAVLARTGTATISEAFAKLTGIGRSSLASEAA